MKIWKRAGWLALLVMTLMSTVVTAAPSRKQMEEAAARAASQGTDAQGSYSVEQLAAMLTEEGYQQVVNKGDHLVFNVDDIRYALFRLDDGDLQLYFGVTDQPLPLDAINEWNRTKRLSRAYIDSEGDIALEADLLANGGLSKERVLAFVTVFVHTSAPEFYQFATSKE